MCRWFVGRTTEANGKAKKHYRSEVFYGTKREAQKFLTEKIAAGVKAKPGRQTVNELLDRYLVDGVERCSPRTAEGHRWLLAKYVRPVIGELRLDKLTALDIQSLLVGMTVTGRKSRNGEKCSPRTKRMVFAVLRKALRKAVGWGLLHESPIVPGGIDLPEEEKRKVRALDDAEWAALRMALQERAAEAAAQAVAATERNERERRKGEAARRAQAALIFDLLVLLGLRPGEALGLRWEDIDFFDLRLSVTRALTYDVIQDKAGKRRQVPVLGPPKTKGSARILPLGPALRDALAAHRSAQAERAAKLGESYDRALDLVFANEVGKPLDERNLAQRHFAPAVEAAKLRPTRLYDLRHTDATALLRRGVDVSTVSARLGHKSTRMTLDVYAHSLSGDQERATALLETALLKTPEPAEAQRTELHPIVDPMN